MTKFLNTRWIIALTLAALMVPVATHAQRASGGAAPNNPPPTSPVTGNAANGKGLYYSYGCYACHGYNGETGARPFVGRWGNLGTEQGFIAFLRGRANVAPLPPSTAMPNFSEASLPDKQARDIYAYIRTFKSSAPDLKDIPALNAIIEASKQDKK